MTIVVAVGMEALFNVHVSAEASVLMAESQPEWRPLIAFCSSNRLVCTHPSTQFPESRGERQFESASALEERSL